MKGYFVGLFVLLTVSGCANTVEYQISPNRFVLPETQGQGELSGKVGLAMGKKTYIVFSKEIKDGVNYIDPPLNDNGTAEFSIFPKNIGSMLLGGSYGVSDNLDAYINLSSLHGSELHIKYMPLGNPATKAAAGDISFAIDLSYAFTEQGEEEGDYNLELSGSIPGVDLVGGYRLNSRSLIYAGLFYTRHNIDLHYTVKDAVGNISVDINPATHSATQYGLDIGLSYEIAHRIGLIAELSQARTEYGPRTHTGSYAAIGVEYRF